jgi:hypothetical protein
MHFGQYLIQSGAATPQQILHALDAQRRSEPLIGSLAFHRGLMSVEQVLQVLDRQSCERRTFGQLAIALEFLTEFQLQVLLQMRARAAVPLSEILVREGILERGSLAELLRGFREHVRSSGAATTAAA